MQGFVSYYNSEKCYGFICADRSIADFFFDGREVIGGAVQRGDEVELWLDDGRRGVLVAVDVKRLRGRSER